ncbi:putatite ferredoxin (partial) [Frankia alni ACN14a]|uniref:Putatite ferredoxin (Partial) n=1 Tax=Frankia alni (strain DSM 45986 / CECT 9034 / ACN14a) TaxID=326424 RepID=Q0RIL7_FRAAA|nr:putatite ferredoxin (partial) [Frankia alni ACN14a]
MLAAPDVFDQRDDDGIVILLDANPPADQHDNVRRAAAVCPAAAIEVLDIEVLDIEALDIEAPGIDAPGIEVRR